MFSVVETLNFVELFPEQKVVAPFAVKVITGTAKLTFAISTPKKIYKILFFNMIKILYLFLIYVGITAYKNNEKSPSRLLEGLAYNLVLVLNLSLLLQRWLLCILFAPNLVKPYLDQPL